MILYIYTILHVTLLALYQRYQFNDTKEHNNDKWKAVRIALDCLTYGVMYLVQFYPFTWQDLLLCSGIYWLLFEVLTNVISLSTDWFFVGTTSKVDALWANKWYYIFGWLLLTLSVKIFL